MICEYTSLTKYLDKSSNIFFLFGSEIILKNDSVNKINSFLEERGFTEKKIISEIDYSNVNKIILEKILDNDQNDNRRSLCKSFTNAWN